jgi:hypothetical protein
MTQADTKLLLKNAQLKHLKYTVLLQKVMRMN